MARTIKQTYDDDRAAGNDPTAEYLIPADNAAGTPLSLNADQLAGIIGERLGTVPQAPNAIFAVTIQPNTKTANIQPISGLTYTHYRIMVDDDSTPSYPSGFVEGRIPLTKEVGAFGVAETWYLWVYDENAGTPTETEVLDADGVSGVAVIPVDTKAPVFASGTSGFNVTGSGSTRSYTIGEPTDAGVGLATTATYDILDDDVPVKSGFTALTGTISTPEREDPYLLQAVARDKSGNVGYSDTVIIDNAPTAANGTLEFSSKTFEGTEGNNITVSLTWDGTGTGSPYMTCYVSTVDNEESAVAGTHYTQVSSQAVNFNAAGTQNVTVSTTNNSSSTNNQCYMVIDYDTRPSNIAIGRESCEIIINSSVSGSSGYAEYTESVTGSSRTIVALECDLGTGKQAIDGISTPADKIVETSSNRAYNNLAAKANHTNHYGTSTTLDPDGPCWESEIKFSTTGTWYPWVRCNHGTGSAANYLHIAVVRPVTSIGANGTGTGGGLYQLITFPSNHGFSNGDTIFFEDWGTTGYNNTTGYTVSSASGAILDILNTGLGADSNGGSAFGESSLLGVYNSTVVTSYWEWLNASVTPTDRSVVINAAGTYKFRVYPQEYNIQFDRVVLMTVAPATDTPDYADIVDEVSATRGNSNDDYYGFAESTYEQGGTPQDNTENTTYFPVALPAATVSPTELLPSNGATAQQDFLRAGFANMTDLIVNKMYGSLGGQKVSGSFTYLGDQATWRPDNLDMSPGSWTGTLEGRVNDSTGSAKSISTGTWAFDIVDSSTTGVLYKMDLSGFQAGTVLSPEQGAVLFENTSIATGPVAAFADGRVAVELDPFGSGQKVLSVLFKANKGGNNETGGQWSTKFGSSQTDLYLAVSYGVDTNYVFSRGVHLPFLSNETFVAESTVNPDTWALMHQMYGNNAYIDSITTPVNRNIEDGCLALYTYDLSRAQKTWYPNLDDESLLDRTDLPFNQPTVGRNTYNTYETRLALNTVPSYDNPDADGVMEAWFNSQLCAQKTNMTWRRDNSQTMERIRWLFWVGGNANNPEWWPNQDQKIYIKSAVVSTSPISH